MGWEKSLRETAASSVNVSVRRRTSVKLLWNSHEGILGWGRCWRPHGVNGTADGRA